MTGAGALVLIVCLGIGAPLCLYWLVRAEHENREVIDREAAERVARRDRERDDHR